MKTRPALASDHSLSGTARARRLALRIQRPTLWRGLTAARRSSSSAARERSWWKRSRSRVSRWELRSKRARPVAERARWRRCSARSCESGARGGGSLTGARLLPRPTRRALTLTVRPLMPGRSARTLFAPKSRAASAVRPRAPMRPGVATSTARTESAASSSSMAARVRPEGRAAGGRLTRTSQGPGSAPGSASRRRGSAAQSSASAPRPGWSSATRILTATSPAAHSSTASTAPRAWSAGPSPTATSTIVVGPSDAGSELIAAGC
jgi:hypothetical protein